MINALLIENTGGALNSLENVILNTCPDVCISGKANSMNKVNHHPIHEQCFMALEFIINQYSEMK